MNSFFKLPSAKGELKLPFFPKSSARGAATAGASARAGASVGTSAGEDSREGVSVEKSVERLLSFGGLRERFQTGKAAPSKKSSDGMNPGAFSARAIGVALDFLKKRAAIVEPAIVEPAAVQPAAVQPAPVEPVEGGGGEVP